MTEQSSATVIRLPRSGLARAVPDGQSFSAGTFPLYRLVAQEGPVRVEDAVRVLRLSASEVLDSKDELMALGLLRDTPNGWIAVPPAQAIDELFSEQSAHLAEALEALRFRQARLAALFRHRSELQAHEVDDISTVSLGADAEGDSGLLAEPTVSLWAIHPGSVYSEEMLASSVARARRLSEKGVRLRALHQTSALAHPKTAGYLLAIQDAGVRVRLRDNLPARMLLVDEAAAICTMPRNNGTVQTFMLRGERVVSLLMRIFESTWLDADALDGALQRSTRRSVVVDTMEPERMALPDGARHGDAGVELSSVQYSIVRALAEGQTDQAIARGLGITARTVTRRVAEIYELLGVESRFQAGIEARRRGLV